MSRVVLLRHGETDWNRVGRIQGWAPVPLNERGREQAAAAAEYVADAYDVARIVTSDLLRARRTTDRVAAAVDAPVERSERWRERDVGVYQGLEYEDLLDRFPEFAVEEAAAAAVDEAPDSGESFAAVQRRVVEGWRAVAGRPGTTLVVTHGGPIYLALGHAKGLDIGETLTEHEQDNCAINEFRIDGRSRSEVVRENATPWR